MIAKFLEYLRYELNRSILTVQAYEMDIFQFQNWLSPGNPGEVDFLTVTSSDVRAWLASLAKAGDSPRTLRRKIISLRTLFKWMMKTGLIKRSPLQDVPLPKLPKPLPDFIRPSEIEEALKIMNEKEWKDNSEKLLNVLVIEILYTLGIRRAELIGINDEDISFSKSEIKVTGKRSKQRVVPVPEKLIEKIKIWQHARDMNQERQEIDHPLLMINGKRIAPRQVYSIVNKALATTTARKKSPHALRHSFASGMLNEGAELDSVREFLGHASLATTQIYTHISLREIKKAYSTAHPRSAGEKK